MSQPPLPPLVRDDAALRFLLTRRSRPAKTLGHDGPSQATLQELLTAAARCPDHGKLEPWRFIVLEGAARARLAAVTRDAAAARGLNAAAADKAAGTFMQGAVIVAVVADPKPSDKIPELEQHLSAGAVCLSLLNAALAAGWGANWLSGWPATDRTVLAAMGVAPPAFVAGFIHIGAETVVPSDRPRPDVDALTTWLSD